MTSYSYSNGQSSKTICEIPVNNDTEDSPSNSCDGEEDLWKLCRICAKSNQYMIPIFEADGTTNNLADIIYAHLPITVSVGDSLPLSICSGCASGLLSWQELVNTCMKSDTLLKSKLQSHNNKVSQHLVKEFIKPEIPPVENCNSRTHKSVAPQSLPLCYTCSFCGVSHDSENDLSLHLVDVHTDHVFLCEECNHYISRTELVPHMSYHAEQEENCEHSSDATFASISGSTSQEKRSSVESNSSVTASPVKPNTVTRSPSQYEHTIYKALDSNSKREMINNYKKSVVPWVKTSRIKEKVCPICGKSFSVASSFHYHMKHYHGGIKEHSCETCGKKFSMRSALIEHYSIHNGSKQFGCSKCGKQFRSKASLYIHTKNKHNGDKNFICDLCDQSFNWKQKLLRHLLSHTKEKAFLCSICSWSFAIKYDLTRHMKTHNSHAHFKCEECSTVYSQWRYLKAHRKRKHPDDDLP